MKLTLLGLALAVCGANAQYFSEGWKPGQAVTAERGVPTGKSGAPVGGRPAQAGQEEGSVNSLSDLLDTTKLMNTDLVKGLFAKAGINITEKLAEAAQNPWDERIPLITDDNYVSMVVNETFASEKEEEERVWVVVVSAQTSRQDGISKFFDAAFDEAYNQTVIAGDLPHVRWARIDYLNVTYLTTKWGVWTAPSIVMIQDRGMTLRFYRSNQLRLANGAFARLPPARRLQEPSSVVQRVCSRCEFVMHYFAIALQKIYDITIRVPRWVLILVSGSLASVVLNLFHGFGPKPKVPSHKKPVGATAPAAAASVAAAAPAATTTGSSTGGGGAKSRKGKKKYSRHPHNP
ncbi:hypothetical protein MKEN_00146500 [Mycena kentingensis (nom. inval.)]|nr:hypothetical protein MKEN_00146500 [Mycena kentingensis (nom. inval.)]